MEAGSAREAAAWALAGAGAVAAGPRLLELAAAAGAAARGGGGTGEGAYGGAVVGVTVGLAIGAAVGTLLRWPGLAFAGAEGPRPKRGSLGPGEQVPPPRSPKGPRKGRKRSGSAETDGRGQDGDLGNGGRDGFGGAIRGGKPPTGSKVSKPRARAQHNIYHARESSMDASSDDGGPTWLPKMKAELSARALAGQSGLVSDEDIDTDPGNGEGKRKLLQNRPLTTPSTRNVPGVHNVYEPAGNQSPSQVLRALLNLEPLTDESMHACENLTGAMDLRSSYPKARSEEDEVCDAPRCRTLGELIPQPFLFDEDQEALKCTFKMVGGVVHVYGSSGKNIVVPPKSAKEYFSDMKHLMQSVSDGQVRSYSHRRLRMLRHFWDLHLQFNASKEAQEQKEAKHRDFYNCRKIDTHVHHSACMNQKHLLRFIKSKVKRCGNDIVCERDGVQKTLRQVFDELGLEPHELNIDLLDMYAGDVKHRFDKFNLKYNPCGESLLREIFLKQDNLKGGEYLAQVTKEVFYDLEESKYQLAEYRLSIYGRKWGEWDTLSKWVINNKLFSNNVVWLIQIPRLFNVYRRAGFITNFQEMLDNIFLPLFEATVDPSAHPEVDCFLKQVVGFDMVDDESKPEMSPSSPQCLLEPVQWDFDDNLCNPPFAYYGYYIYSNLQVLNQLRRSRGMNTFAFRPHSGEAGAVDHLGCAFLLADNIQHGTNLRKSPALQYLFYLSQIGISMSPLSNNSLFLDYNKNPFPDFFSKGLNVTLSTDDPLQIHFTKEPLVEEYSIAAQVWRLSSCDLCEIARNSCLISGFPGALKKHWVSDNFWYRGPAGNDIMKTNVPNVRLQFRTDMLEHERNLLAHAVDHQHPEDEEALDAASEDMESPEPRGRPHRAIAV